MVPDANDYAKALSLSCEWRSALKGETLVLHHGAGNFKKQMKKADKSGAKVALIWGDDEVANNTVSLKALRESAGSQERPGQRTVALDELEAALAAALAS